MYWICSFIRCLILDSHTHLIQLNQFRDSNYANAVTQKIENHLIYFNSSLATFAIFDNGIPLRNK